ncbi:MAG: chemotaxis protein CheW [Deltaproteobacteria bacterium]|nr:chemotaxis protein CheW [Deltaproteobacteria bacterium]MBW2723932.1 chemotaxis protein CheW [Deltaproteobacteria bacterium]
MLSPQFEEAREGGASRPGAQTPKPAATVRVRTKTLDRFLGAVGEVILSSRQLRGATHEGAHSAEQVERFDRVERRVNELQRRVLDLRTTPLLRVMENLPRVARQVAESLGKRVDVQLLGTELELDRSILDRLNEPLRHIIRNAVDHGLETVEDRIRAGKSEVGQVVIEARRERNSIVIEVNDDGRGIDLDAVRKRAVESGLLHSKLAEDLPNEELAGLIFRPGLSTASQVSDVSGRGVGMDAVKATVESLGGAVSLLTAEGQGTTMRLEVPITAAVQRVLLVEVAGERVALPIAKVERILEIPATSIEDSGGEMFTMIDDEPILVLDLADCLQLEGTPPPDSVPLAVTDVRGEIVALRISRLVSQQEVYVKPVPELLSTVKALAGMTILEDGCPVFLLDLNHLV